MPHRQLDWSHRSLAVSLSLLPASSLSASGPVNQPATVAQPHVPSVMPVVQPPGQATNFHNVTDANIRLDVQFTEPGGQAVTSKEVPAFFVFDWYFSLT